MQLNGNQPNLEFTMSLYAVLSINQNALNNPHSKVDFLLYQTTILLVLMEYHTIKTDIISNYLWLSFTLLH